MKQHQNNKIQKGTAEYHEIIKIIIKRVQYEKRCSMKRVRHTKRCNMKRIQHEKIAT